MEKTLRACEQTNMATHGHVQNNDDNELPQQAHVAIGFDLEALKWALDDKAFPSEYGRDAAVAITSRLFTIDKSFTSEITSETLLSLLAKIITRYPATGPVVFSHSQTFLSDPSFQSAQTVATFCAVAELLPSCESSCIHLLFPFLLEMDLKRQYSPAVRDVLLSTLIRLHQRNPLVESDRQMLWTMFEENLLQILTSNRSQFDDELNLFWASPFFFFSIMSLPLQQFICERLLAAIAASPSRWAVFVYNSFLAGFVIHCPLQRSLEPLEPPLPYALSLQLIQLCFVLEEGEEIDVFADQYPHNSTELFYELCHSVFIIVSTHIDSIVEYINLTCEDGSLDPLRMNLDHLMAHPLQPLENCNVTVVRIFLNLVSESRLTVPLESSDDLELSQLRFTDSLAECSFDLSRSVNQEFYFDLEQVKAHCWDLRARFMRELIIESRESRTTVRGRSSSECRFPFETLPDDVLIHILTLCTGRSIGRMISVCFDWSERLQHDFFWKTLLLAQIPKFTCIHETVMAVSSSSSKDTRHEWRKLYIKAFRARLRKLHMCCRCDCFKTFHNVSSLKTHTKSHEPPKGSAFCCPVETCRKEYKAEEYFQAHMQMHQQQDTPLPCNVSDCDLKFSNIFDLRLHLKSQHKQRLQIPEAKLIQCKFEGCSVRLVCKSAYKRHLVSHSRVKEFACPQCPSMFSRKMDVWRHLSSKAHGAEQQQQEQQEPQPVELRRSKRRKIPLTSAEHNKTINNE